MIKLIFAIFFIAVQAIKMPAAAQNTEISIESKLNLELTEIKQKKLEIESSFKTREAVCYKNFAVSNCLQDLKSEKLLVLSDIKRRALEINDQIRQIKLNAYEKKANEKSKKIDEKEQLKDQAIDQTLNPDANDRKTAKTSKTRKTVKETEAPAENNKSKLAEQRALAAKQRVLDANMKQAASQQKAQSRARKLKQSGEQEAKFNQKQLDAQAHKTAVEKAAAEKTKPKSASLPIPSTQLPKQ